MGRSIGRREGWDLLPWVPAVIRMNTCRGGEEEEEEGGGYCTKNIHIFI